MLTEDQISHLAHLARLHLTEDEKKQFASQIGSILEYVAALQAVDTDGVEEMVAVAEVANVFREDTVEACSAHTHMALLANMPSKEGELLKVQAAIGKTS